MSRISKAAIPAWAASLPEWAQDILCDIATRAVMWSAVNGLSRPEPQPEDATTLRVLRLLSAALTALRQIEASDSLDMVKIVAADTVRLIESGRVEGNA